MGFKSTFVSEDANVKWPKWFKEKYKSTIIFPSFDKNGQIASSMACTTYFDWICLIDDIKIVINSLKIKHFYIVFLHESGDITRIQINGEFVYYSVPKSWIY